MDRIDVVLAEIGQEVKRAKQIWGEDFDRRNTINDWAAYVNFYLGRATSMSASTVQQQISLRKAAGLLISAIDMLQRHGFAPRHYDGQTSPTSLPEIE